MLAHPIVSFIMLAGLVAPAPLVAQEAETPPPTAVVDTSPETLAALGTSSPRGAMFQFIAAARRGDYTAAAEHLNLRNLPPALRDLEGDALARDFHTVLDRTLWIEWESLSDSEAGFSDDGLPRAIDRVGAIDAKEGSVDILVEQANWHDGKPVWKVASQTVARIPELYEEFGYGTLGRILPRVLVEQRIFDVRLWQWIALALLIVLAATFGALLSRLASAALRPVFARARTHLDDQLIELTPGPLRLVFFALLLTLGLPPIGLALPVLAFLATVAKGLLVIGAIWLTTRLVDVASTMTQERLVAQGQAIAMSVVPLGRRLLKALLIAIAALFVLQNFGFNVTGLVAGLGIGGLAFALAAQKSIENLFGGVTLIADRPVAVGDFCRFGDRVGTVEEVGMRSTRVRTLERTVVTIPNGEFASMQIENFAHRDRIWFHTTLGVRYETSADQMRFLLLELKKLLVGHPKVHPDPARARFVGFGAFSLDIEIFAYVMTRDINEFLAVREDLLLRIIDLVENSGTGFAFPSQTIYTASDSGIDADRGKAAMEEIARLRGKGELGLPNFRTEQLTELSNRLEYPDLGAAVRPRAGDERAP